MLAPAIARELSARGHDVTAIAGDPAHESLPDPEVLALARSQRRALVTNNIRDFRPLHNEAVAPGGPGHFGIISCPPSSGEPSATSARSWWRLKRTWRRDRALTR